MPPAPNKLPPAPNKWQECMNKVAYPTVEAAEAELRYLRKRWRKAHKEGVKRMHAYACSMGKRPAHWHLGHRPWWAYKDDTAAG